MSLEDLARYRRSVAYLESLLTLESERLVSKVDPSQPGGPIGLRRCRRLLAHLGNPQETLRFVHVTGTSGKGSVVRLVHSMLHEGGIRVGSYMSPHVTTTLERIPLGGGFLPISHWVRAVEALKPYIEREYREGPWGIPSYHELVLGIALSSFRDLGCQVVVLEVGIGGSLDSTNVIPSPLIAVVTDVGIDHVELLGRDVRTIARDKAGIIKPGTLAMVGARREEALEEVLRQARTLDVPTWVLGDQIRVEQGAGTFDVVCPDGAVTGVRPGLVGAHQGRNAALAVAVAVHLRSLGLAGDDDSVRRGVARAFLPGRFEEVRLDGGQVLVMDIAHNVDKVRAAVDTWVRRHGDDGAVVVAVAGNKDLDGILGALRMGFRKLVATRPLGTFRKMAPPRLLARQAAHFFPTVDLRLDPWDALLLALRMGEGKVLACGSTYLISELRARFQEETVVLNQGQIAPLNGEYRLDASGSSNGCAHGPGSTPSPDSSPYRERMRRS